MKIAVEGCAHGKLQDIYDTIEMLEKKNDFKIDLLICCGDFQSTRNHQDLESMAVPNKYKELGSFPCYYSGQKVAPVLTIFIGGNHEASNYLQELPYGGWVAPNIYYMGYSGIVNIAGIRIGGISGIYKNHDYHRGRFEISPYNMNSIRSVYHVRNLDVFRLKQVKEPIDIFFSHDWPLGIYKHGDAELLIKLKSFFEEEIEKDKLGSPVNQELLLKLKPKYWFAGHLHVKFAAIVPHINENEDLVAETKFLALDKCLPKRQFLQVFDFEHDSNKEISIEYDLEWLTILHFTNHLISVEQSNNYLPGPGSQERWLFTPTDSEKEFVLKKMSGDLKVPQNFEKTIECSTKKATPRKTTPMINNQTSRICQLLGIDDPIRVIMGKKDFRPPASETPENFESSTFIESDQSGLGSDIEKSPKCDESPNKRSSLVLPPPKFEESDIQVSSSGIVPDEKLFIIDDGSKRDNEEPQPEKNKKFKRRNQSFYANTD